MCDTIYVPSDKSKTGRTLFAKNSDRDPNEASVLEYHPGGKHNPGDMVQCTYISIPQAVSTNAVMLARPFWMWGAEMGTNEHGVTIGNEAVFTRIKYRKTGGLTGMDLLRLALERAVTAREALQVIIDLLEKFGQGGNCGFLHEFFYHNSFLIVDPGDAWVLETAGEHWAAEHVNGIRTISNAITITNKWDMCSKNLIPYAVKKGWCKGESDFDFSRCYSDPIITKFADGRSRQSCTTLDLAGSESGIDTRFLMKLLRNHRGDKTPGWSPERGLTGADVCMHAGFGPVRVSETASSMVSELGAGMYQHWFTGTAAPCTGIFKPVWFDAGMPDTGPLPGGKYDGNSMWWQHELLHRDVLKDYTKRISIYQPERDDLEQSFLREAGELWKEPAEKRFHHSTSCFTRASESTRHWREMVRDTPLENPAGGLYGFARKKFNKLAAIPE